MYMKRFSIEIGLLLILLFGNSSNAAPIVSLQPNTQSFNSGDQVTTTIAVNGLAAGSAVGTFDAVVGFDPGLLLFTSAAFGNQLDLFGLGDINSVTPIVGSVELFELSLESSTDLNTLQQKAFTLGTLSFTALGPAINSSVFSLTVVALGDASGNSLLQSANSVPEPSSAFLMLSGLSVALIIVRQRTFRVKAPLHQR